MQTVNICTDLLYKHAVYMVALEKYGTFLLYLLIGLFFIYTAIRLGSAEDALNTQKQSNTDESKVLHLWAYICSWSGAFIILYGTLTMLPKELDVLAAQKIPPACVEFSLLKK